jgi:integrase
MADLCDLTTLRGQRDRSLLLLGFAGAFRRAELVALTVADLEEVTLGLRVRVRRSKTDQEGQGSVIPIRRGTTHCPVSALRSWLRAAAITDGPVFRALWKGGVRVRATPLSAGAVAEIVKCYATRVGLDPGQFAGHSLRAGFLTSAAGRGASLWKLRDVSRHRSVDTLAGYVRDAELFTDHAGDGLL